MVDEKGNSFIPALGFFGCSNQKIPTLDSNYLTLSYLVQMSHAGFEDITVRIDTDHKFDNFLMFRMPEIVKCSIVEVLLLLRPKDVSFHGNGMSLTW